MVLYRESEHFQEQKAISAIKKNTKYFFKYAKKFAKVKSKIGPLKTDNGNIISKPSEMAEMLSKQFSEMFSKPQNGPFQKNNSEAILSDVDFDKKDIVESIDELGFNSAPGFDGFPAILLKKCKEELCAPLTYIWKESLREGSIPSTLKTAIITPIHKGGSKFSPERYRPVALTSHLIKIFEKIIKKKLVSFFEEYNLFNPGQHGFRKGRSCLSQLLIHFEDLLNIVGRGENADVIYLDFSKAFDKVDFNILLQKLSRLGVGGTIYRWIEQFLTNRRQCVAVNGFISAFVEVLSGVPQGSVLGPLLFLVMMKDIDEDTIHAIIKSFADDTRAMLGIQSKNDMVNLQTDLNTIYEWAELNNLQFNDLKFELMQYGDNEGLKDSHQYLSSSQVPLEASETVKDLGVLMSHDFSFRPHIDTIIEDAKSRAAWVLRTFKSRNPSAMLTLWKSMVLPKLEYCSQLWCPTKKGDILKLEEVQRYFVRKICFDSNADMNYWERLSCLGLYSLQRRRERYRILYTWQIIEKRVPNICTSTSTGIQSKINERTGRTCVFSKAAFVKTRALNIYDSSMAVHGSKLYNCLPKYIRNLSGCSINSFKHELDKLLKHVPDQPVIPGYVGGNQALYGSNSLIDILPNLQNP